MNLHTYSDLDAIPSTRIWQLLRTTRHSPPGRAISGRRKGTYNAALEQAEQLLNAARTVSPATRPLLLFYGVSQFGRAIAAASVRLNDKQYQPSGHGLTHTTLEGSDKGRLATIRIGGDANGTFPTVAKAMGKSAMRTERPLGEVWSWIPDAARIPLPRAATGYPILRVAAGLGLLDPAWQPIEIQGLPATVFTSSQPHGATLDQERIRALLARYPGLISWQQEPLIHGELRGRFDVSSNTGVMGVSIPAGNPTPASGFTLAGTTTYHASLLLTPDADDGLAVHPFLAWWQVLYVLSRLARYCPNEWGEMISIAANKQAAAIEYLLSEALEALPELGLRGIEDAVGHRLTTSQEQP